MSQTSSSTTPRIFGEGKQSHWHSTVGGLKEIRFVCDCLKHTWVRKQTIRVKTWRTKSLIFKSCFTKLNNFLSVTPGDCQSLPKCRLHFDSWEEKLSLIALEYKRISPYGNLDGYYPQTVYTFHIQIWWFFQWCYLTIKNTVWISLHFYFLFRSVKFIIPFF